MRGYERDDYENWDEYETEGEEEEEEYEEPEPEQPPQEQLEYLEFRQHLKENIRKKLKKEAGSSNADSRDRVGTSRKDTFGSFFGPSQPVIAQRVIQESRALLENPELAAKITNRAHNSNKKSSGSAPVSSKSQVKPRPTVVNGVKKKAEMIKHTRDYSFLDSEDAEVPAPARNPPPRSVSAPKSDARPAQVPPKSKQVVSDRRREVDDGRRREIHNGHRREIENGHRREADNGHRREVDNGHRREADNGHRREVDNGRDARRPVVSSSQSRPKVPERSNGKLPVEPRRQLGNTNGNGPGRPLAPKGGPSRTSVPATRKVTPPVVKSTVVGSHRPNPSSQQLGTRKPLSSSQSQKSGTVHRRSPPRGQPSGFNKSSVQRMGDNRDASRPKAVPKPPLREEQVRRPPPKSSMHDVRPKPKPKRRRDDEIDDDREAIMAIRKMFRYNPNKYRDYDDDLSDMEANFDDIQREENRSLKIARKEDEEQLRLIEEEEKRERERALRKKQKVR